MENNEIIKRLLQEDSNESSKSTATKQTNKNNDTAVSKIRVVTAKYKVYIVLLLIFICILWLESIPTINRTYDSKKSSYDQATSQLSLVKGQIRDAENDVIFRQEIVDNEDTLKTCLNNLDKSKCLSLPEDWEQDISVPLSYLQVNSLYSPKMPVDEKKVLKNLDKYLIQEDIEGNTRSRVGTILKISIGDPESIKDSHEHFFQVPVDVSIEFQTVGDLTGFLYNVEKKMIDNSDDRILYKIQSVSYDVVSRDEPQITDINMLAYYYYDEKFENVDETDDVNSEDSDVSEENDDKDEKSQESTSSFLNKIFN